MEKIYYIGLLLIFGIFGACSEEDELMPSGNEKEWTVIEDPGEDASQVDKLRYEIYRDFGISFYYNDTIGSEERIDMAGNKYTYHERLKLFYAPGTVNNATRGFTLLEDPATLAPVFEYLQNNILPRFDKGLRFPAFLFVDSLYTEVGLNPTIKREMESYYGYNVLTMKADSVKQWGVKEFCSRFLSNYLGGSLNSSLHSNWRKSFLQISVQLNPSAQYLYSTSMTSGTEWSTAFAGTNFTKKEELGFIISTLKGNYYYTYESTPTELEDLQSYVRVVLDYTKEEFKVKYGEFPAVMEKYNLMRAKVQELGYKL